MTPLPAHADPPSGPSPVAARPPWLAVLAFFGLVVAVLVLARHLDLRQALSPEVLRAAGASPTPTLVGLLGLLWLAMVGSSGPAIAAGTVLFGWAGGTGASLLGMVAAHSTWFLLARTALRPLVQARATPRVRWLTGAIQQGGLSLAVSWNLLGGPGTIFLFAAALSGLRLRDFVLGLLASLPRILVSAVLIDTLLVYDLATMPAERWRLLLGLIVPMTLAYVALVALRPELRPWRFGRPPADAA
ncbi:VTT domain-containing protein [Myxococcota bacterium]|nr:VTT domain-containing protein [Myxococcota bacterium]